jgi:hypothetical protein
MMGILTVVMDASMVLLRLDGIVVRRVLVFAQRFAVMGGR